MKKYLAYLFITIFIIACDTSYQKSKKGDFSFRKCTKCGLNNENETY